MQFTNKLKKKTFTGNLEKDHISFKIRQIDKMEAEKVEVWLEAG